jgi:hypothetical protein
MREFLAWLFEPLYRKLTDYLGDRGFILYGGGKGGSSAPPPDPRLVEAQIRSMGYSDQAIQQMMANSNEMLPIQKEQMQFGLDTSRQAWNQSQEDRQWALGRRGQLTGAQDMQLSQLNEFNADKEGDQFAARARADVQAAAAREFGAQERGLMRRSVNPNSGKFAALSNERALKTAAMDAGAATGARLWAKDKEYGLTDRVVNALSGYPSMGMQTTGAGAGFGGMGLQLANSGLGGMNSGFGAASTAASQMGQGATSMYGAQATNYNQGQNQKGEMYGSLLGTGATIAAAFI